MKTVGTEVCFLGTGEGNPRNGEGAFIRLSDGRIMYAFTKYDGDSWLDHAIAGISACVSCDEGESWSKPASLIEKEAWAENIMSVSLLRLSDGRIMIVYLRKTRTEDGRILCMPVIRYSSDECETFTEAKNVDLADGYYVLINDGATVAADGRIYIPLSYHCKAYDVKLGAGDEPKTVHILYSDDLGESFQEFRTVFQSPHASDKVGLAEPGIYEHEDGSLFLWCRTALGFQYSALSLDRGKTWSALEPNLRFTSPDSPMRVKRVGELTVAVFNPYGYSCLREGKELWGSPKRTPLALAVSQDDGHSFSSVGKPAYNGGLSEFSKNVYLIEDDERDSYCYPAIIGTEDGFLVAYYHSAGTRQCLNATRIKKVLFSELT